MSTIHNVINNDRVYNGDEIGYILSNNTDTPYDNSNIYSIDALVSLVFKWVYDSISTTVDAGIYDNRCNAQSVDY